MDQNTPFHLSRVQAEGWNAARKYLLDDIDEAKIAALNPYKASEEKARWHAGFTGALQATGAK